MYLSCRITAVKFSGLVSTLLLFVIAFSHCLFADTITVNTATDTASGDCLAVSTCSLRRAVLDASSGDIITFSPALYNQTIYLSLGEIGVDKNIDINGDLDSDKKPDIGVDGSSSSRIFTLSGASIVTLQGLVIKNGGVTYPEKGGGVQIIGGSIVSIKDSSFLSNAASDTGVIFTGGGEFL